MARKAIKLASWTSMALAASGVYLYSNSYLDPSDFGAVRVGRAVATVGFFFLWGYLWVFLGMAGGCADIYGDSGVSALSIVRILTDFHSCTRSSCHSAVEHRIV